MTHFTPAQMNEIRKFRVASLLCNNMDVTSILQNPFFYSNISSANPTVNCSNLPKINWALFGV